jgi:hypothetical protein
LGRPGIRLKHRTEPLSSPAVEHRNERIVVETDRYRITGVLRLPPDGYRSRLTDCLNSSERVFVALTDVEVVPLPTAAVPKAAHSSPFLSITWFWRCRSMASRATEGPGDVKRTGAGAGDSEQS